MLELHSLHSGYDGMEVLRGIDLSVGPSEIVALIGPNGSGKSTILKSIFNLCSIYSGSISLEGKDITKIRTHDLIRLGVGFVPQGRHVFYGLTVQENLEMGAFIISDKKVVDERLCAVYEEFPILEEKKDDDAANLSGGQQQLLAIARALMQKPRLLLMDEPSLGLSPKVMKEIFEKIVEINKKGVSILLVEQNARQAIKIAHKTYLLENGSIVLSGGKNIVKNKVIKSVYLGGE